MNIAEANALNVLLGRVMDPEQYMANAIVMGGAAIPVAVACWVYFNLAA